METKTEENKSQHNRVQFTDETDEIGHDSDISVRMTASNLIDIHLGFLQIRHRYEITFRFECQPIDGSLVVRNSDSFCPNLNLHVIDLRNDSNDSTNNEFKYRITIELFAHKEKLIKEQICLHSSENPSQTLTLIFHARVLGKGKGTPFLKNGIKCIGQEMDEDDNDSDWPGFN